MKKFFKYSIQERKYSSNAIQGHYLNEDNKEQTSIVMMSALPKKDGDQEMLKVMQFLNREIAIKS